MNTPDLAAFLAAAPVARVELVRVQGSSPREAGTFMFVTPDSIFGTIGGGRLEHMAVTGARRMLENGGDQDRLEIPLGPEIGQCCGGRVDVGVTRMTWADKKTAAAQSTAQQAAYPCVYVFGAGHVGRALADCMALLPVRAVLVDERAEELALCAAPVRKILSVLPEDEVRAAPPGGAFVILTHEHATDFIIAAEALARADAAYVGMIGSKTKRASFERWCAKNARPPVDASRLVCPIGDLGCGDKRPAVIAAAAAAEIMTRLNARAKMSEAAMLAGAA